MFEYRYKVYFDNIWFVSLYGTDYYYDKSIFFADGAKQFFTIYQIVRTGDFELTIVEKSSGDKFEVNDSDEFKIWVEKNYNSFANYLDRVYWDKHPESKLI